MTASTSRRHAEPWPRTGTALHHYAGLNSIKAAYNQLVTVVGAVSARYLRPPHAAHTKRLTMLQSRLTHSGRPVPGLTTHQAKGGEWDIVGVVLSDTERSSLGVGLSVTQDTHRKIYVATTRARYRTIEVMSAPPPPSKRAAGKTAKSTTAKHIAGLT